jgi:hypothetical protein
MVVALVSGLLPSCHAHQELVAPDSSASIEEREAAYEQLKPLSYHETHITYVRGFVPVGTEKQVDYLQLADGRRVYYPEDILPVVPEDSSAAAAAQSSESARTTSTTLRALGVGGWVVGGVIAFVPFFTPRDYDEPINLTPVWAGLAVVGVGSILYLVGGGFSSTANDEAATAFETYDTGLRERLGICSPTDRSPACRRQANRTATTSPDEKPPAAPPTAAAAPEGVAGFRFGTDEARVREACESNQHHFAVVEQTATCSGMAANLGVPGRAGMVFCDGKLCEIEVTLETDAENYGRVLAKLRKQLTSRYGAAAQASVRSEDCRGGLKSCVFDFWRWPSGHRVVLTMGLLDAKNALLLTYSTPQRSDTSSPGPAL